LLEEDGADELVDVRGVGESRKLGGDSAILGELGFEGLAGGDAGLEVWKSRVREVGGKKYYLSCFAGVDAGWGGSENWSITVLKLLVFVR
jgi:hypothetical protein